MATIKCPGCGLIVSDDDGECFACGFSFAKNIGTAENGAGKPGMEDPGQEDLAEAENPGQEGATEAENPGQEDLAEAENPGQEGAAQTGSGEEPKPKKGVPPWLFLAACIMANLLLIGLSFGFSAFVANQMVLAEASAANAIATEEGQASEGSLEEEERPGEETPSDAESMPGSEVPQEAESGPGPEDAPQPVGIPESDTPEDTEILPEPEMPQNPDESSEAEAQNPDGGLEAGDTANADGSSGAEMQNPDGGSGTSEAQSSGEGSGTSEAQSSGEGSGTSEAQSSGEGSGTAEAQSSGEGSGTSEAQSSGGSEGAEPAQKPKDTSGQTTASKKTENSAPKAFSPKDLSDAAIESIATYGDFLTMYQLIQADYLKNLEQAMKGTVYYNGEAFQKIRRDKEAEYALLQMQYASLKEARLPSQEAYVRYLKAFRDSLWRSVAGLNQQKSQP